MRDWLIRAIGGITPNEMSQLSISFLEGMKTKDKLISVLESELAKSNQERRELNQLFLQKAGFIPQERRVPNEKEILTPINTRSRPVWQTLRDLERSDAKKVEDQWKKKDPQAVRVGGQDAS